jgi:hypothetical protein
MSDIRRNPLTIIEDDIREFEDDSKWRLSLPARIVLQQGYLSLSTDQIGLVGLTELPQRRLAQQKAFEALRPFLDEIGRKADQFIKERQIERDNATEIGAIFMMQHINVWAIIRDCGCYPQ